MTWWNSLEIIQWWSNAFNVCLAICGLLIGFLGIGALILGLRAAKLELQHEEKLEQDRNQLTIRLEKAEHEATSAQKSTETARIDLIKSKQEHAALKQSLVATQEELLPRHLREDESRKLTAALNAHPKGKLAIVAIANDPEASNFANEFQRLFQASGWAVGPVAVETTNPPPVGVRLETGRPTSPDTSPLDSLDAVDFALVSAGIPFESVTNGNLSPGSFRLVIGSKPT